MACNDHDAACRGEIAAVTYNQYEASYIGQQVHPRSNAPGCCIHCRNQMLRPPSLAAGLADLPCHSKGVLMTPVKRCSTKYSTICNAEDQSVLLAFLSRPADLPGLEKPCRGRQNRYMAAATPYQVRVPHEYVHERQLVKCTGKLLVFDGHWQPCPRPACLCA